ncbi:hypothetical protein KAR10_09910 [bacterium]|nr:hypothetical protein [bacterium]
MNTYNDMTFCGFWKECGSYEVCSRALTEEVVQAAVKADIPICQFLDKPDCFEMKSIKDVAIINKRIEGVENIK